MSRVDDILESAVKPLNESVEAIPKELNAKANKLAKKCPCCGYSGAPMGKVCAECGTPVEV